MGVLDGAGQREYLSGLLIGHEVAALQATIDWRPVYLVLQQEVWTCSCGAKGFTPQGIFIYQEHTRMSHCWRLVRLCRRHRRPAG